MNHPARQYFRSPANLSPLGDLFARVQSAAHDADTSPYSRQHPTPEQLANNRYRLGLVTMHGMGIRIENPHGTRREGVGADGKAWSNLMASHYGDIAGTRGADGDPIDVFIGPFPERTVLWVINQIDPRTGAFDEHKVMLGYADESQARDAYNFSYDRGWAGLSSLVRATVSQFKWWLKFGDKSRPFTPDVLPYEGTATMDKVLWNNQAEPVTKPLQTILYELRGEDAGHGLMLDALSMAEIMSDPDIEAIQVLDAMVVEVGRMQPKMEALQRVMAAAGEAVKPTEVVISAPVRYRGVAQVMALFTMSDGQTVSIWFHNPDTTPAKLMPLDELISWKWMLNKMDVTIVVAPEKGRDLNPREVSRRIMRLVEKNSAAFTKANAKVAEKAAQLEALDTEIAAWEAELTDVQRQIELAKVEAESRAIAKSKAADEERRAAEELAKNKAPSPDAASKVLERANAIADRLIAFYGWKKSSENDYPELAAMLDSPRGTNWVLLEEKGGKLDYDGNKELQSYADTLIDNMDAMSNVDVAKAIDLADFKSETETSDEGVIADGQEFAGKTPEFAHAAEILRYGAGLAGAKVNFGDFSGSTTGSLLDDVGMGVVAHPYADVSIYGITAQIGVGATVLGRAMIDEKGAITILKGSGGVQAVGEPKDGTDVKQIISELMASEAAKPQERVEFTYAGRLIYPTSINMAGEVSDYWAVQTDENAARAASGQRTLGGDLLAKSVDQAKEMADGMNAEAERALKSTAEIKSFEEAQAKAAAEREAGRMAGLDGFVDGMVPMQKERALTALNKIIRRQGEDQPIKKLMRSLVDAGWTVGVDRTYGRSIIGPDGSFIEQQRITKTGLDFAEYLIAKKSGAAAKNADGKDTIASVDAAYLFASATDEFKNAVAGSVGDESYSPFQSAKAIDMAVKKNGGTVSWALSMVLDSVVDGRQDGDDDEGEDFDPEAEFNAYPDDELVLDQVILDGDFRGHPFRGNQYIKTSSESHSAVRSSQKAKHAEKHGDHKAQKKSHKIAHYAHMAAAEDAKSKKTRKYHRIMAKFHGSRAGLVLDSVAIFDAVDTAGSIVGTIKSGGAVIGRAQVSGDGKSMIFVGQTMERIKFVSKADGALREFMWSDDGVSDMVDALFTVPENGVAKAPEPAPVVPAENDMTRLNDLSKLVSKDAIRSDDPQAIEKLQAKMNYLAAYGEMMRKANKLMRKQDRAGLAAMGFNAVNIEGLFKPDFAGRTGFADYMMSNNTAEVRRTRLRLEELMAAATPTPPTPAPVVPAPAPEPSPAPTPVPPEPQVDPQKATDTAYLQSMIDGTANLLAPDVLEKLEPMFEKYAPDAAMMDLLERAAQAYGDAAVEAAKQALGA